MSDDAQLRTWVSDKLFSLLGYSQPAVVTFIIGIAKKCASPTEVFHNLVKNGFSSSTETHTFAEDIYSKVPHKAAGLNSYQKAEKEAALFALKQAEYTLLDADYEEDQGSLFSSISIKSSGVLPIKKKKRKHEEEEDKHKLEEDRVRDQHERVELEKRLREKDAAATRKIMEPTLTRKEQKEAIRRSKALQENVISNMRKISRQEYLKKRELKKLDELRDDIEDEEYLFEGIHVTEKEHKEIRYKKEIYKLARNRAEEVDEIMEEKRL